MLAKEPFNIAVVRFSAIGDCVLVLPVIRAILEELPNAKIHWIIGKGAYQLLKDCQQDNLQFHPIDKPKSWSDYRALKKQFSEFNFDCLLEMQASTRANLLYPLLRAKRKIGFDKTRARELQWLFSWERIDFKDNHLHESFAQFVEKLGLDLSPTLKNKELWRIDLPQNKLEQWQAQLALPAQFIAINPAASKKQRSWTIDAYCELIEALSEKYVCPLVLTGGKADFEIEMANTICLQLEQASSSAKVINQVGQTSLQQLAFVLQQAKLLIAPDTGPAHIANAMATPVVGLYATAPSKLSGPYFYKDLCVDRFAQGAIKYLQKEHNQLAWKARVHHPKVMELIDLDAVLVKVAQAWDMN